MTVLISTTGFGQKTFGVSPGTGFSGAYFGIKKEGKLMPYIGFQYASVGYSYEESGRRFDYDELEVVRYTDEEKIRVGLLVPNVGVRYYLKENEQLKTFLNLNVAKPFVIGKQEEDGREVESFKEDTKKLKMFGAELGFGTEYYLSEQFALGGEFGLRYFALKFEDKRTDEIYDPIEDEVYESETNYAYKASLSPTYSRIYLSFFF